MYLHIYISLLCQLRGLEETTPQQQQTDLGLRTYFWMVFSTKELGILGEMAASHDLILLDFITSRRKALSPILSRWGLGLQHLDFRGTQTSVRTVLGETNIHVRGPRKADCSPQHGWASSNQFQRTWTEKENWAGKPLLSDCSAGTRVFLHRLWLSQCYSLDRSLQITQGNMEEMPEQVSYALFLHSLLVTNNSRESPLITLFILFGTRRHFSITQNVPSVQPSVTASMTMGLWGCTVLCTSSSSSSFHQTEPQVFLPHVQNRSGCILSPKCLFMYFFSRHL